MYSKGGVSILIIIIKAILFMSIFIMSFQVVKSLFKIFNKRIEEAQCTEEKEKRIRINFQNVLYGNEKYKGFFEKISVKLDRKGNPFKLTPITFLALKCTCSIFTFAFLSYIGHIIQISLIFSIMSFFLIDGIYYLSSNDDKNKINKSLPDICDVLNIQTSSGVKLGLALKEIFDIPKLERLRKDLFLLAAEINFTSDVEKSLNNFEKKYIGYQEVESFVISLKQAIVTGKSKEILKNQSLILKENNLLDVDDETKKIDSVIVLFVTFLLFTGLLLIIIYSFKNQITNNLHQIFS